MTTIKFIEEEIKRKLQSSSQKAESSTSESTESTDNTETSNGEQCEYESLLDEIIDDILKDFYIEEEAKANKTQDKEELFRLKYLEKDDDSNVNLHSFKAVGYYPFKRQLGKCIVRKPKHLYIYFCGSKDENGTNWCPDCEKAEQTVIKTMENAPCSSHFIYCVVGNREEWKNHYNPFRIDAMIQLSCIPTLLEYNTINRLEGEQCCDSALIVKMFKEK